MFQIEGITPAGALGGSTGRKLKGFYKGMKGKGEVGANTGDESERGAGSLVSYFVF